MFLLPEAENRPKAALGSIGLSGSTLTFYDSSFHQVWQTRLRRLKLLKTRTYLSVPPMDGSEKRWQLLLLLVLISSITVKIFILALT